MSDPPRWPKGPFPEKYRWQTVERRLAGAWSDPARAELPAILAALGLAPYPAHDDPYVRVFTGDPELAAVRAAIGDRAYAFRWIAPEGDPVRAIGVVASRDPIDAAIAVGVAGPRFGIGTAAIVRFLVALRSFAAFEIRALGEDRLEMSIEPRDPGRALRIAERVLQICPAAARATSAEALAAAMQRDHHLELSWAP